MTAYPALAPAPRYRLDDILEQRLSPASLLLVNKFTNKKLDEAGYDACIDALKQATPASGRPALDEQIAVAALALGNKPGFAFKKLRLDTEEERLLWAAVIGRIAQNPAQHGDIGRHPAWNRVKNSDWAQLERMQNHAHLYQSTQDKKARVGWGKPGTGFYYSPDENHINLDLLFTLVDPDYLHVYYHEEGHRLLTTDFPPSFNAQREKLAALAELQQQRPLSPLEVEQHIEARTRADLLMIGFNALEDNMVDMYSVKRFRQERRPDAEGAVLRHDVVTGMIGQNAAKYDAAMRAGTPLAPKPDPSLQEQWHNLLLASAAAMAMRQEFGFLPNNEEAWRRIGVEPGWLEAKGAHPGEPPLTGMDALNLLQDYARRIGDEQPPPALYADPAALKQAAPGYAATRNALIEEVFERFSERLIAQLVQQRQEEAKKQQQQKQEAGEQPGALGENQPAAAGGEGNAMASGSGQMVVIVPPATPGEAARQGAAVPPNGQKEENPSLEQLEREAEQQQAALDLERLRKDAQDNTPPPAGKPPRGKPADDSPPADENRPGAAMGAEDEPEQLRRRGSLNEYQKMALRRINATDGMAQLLAEIQKRQVELVARPQELGIIPQRKPLDINAHARLKIAQAMGEAQEHHYRRFPQEEITRQPPLMTIAALFDGSGSVREYMDDIIGTGCALREAADKVNQSSPRPSIDFHMNLWGAQQAVRIAAPGDEPDEVAKAIEAARQCSFPSSNLAPSLVDFLKTVTGQDTRRGPARLQAMASSVGMTHLFVVSDGDLDDLPNAAKALRAVLEHCKKVTFDVVVIDRQDGHAMLMRQQRGPTNMDRLVMQMKTEFGDRVSVTHVPPAKIEQGMLNALNHTLERCKDDKAIPYPEAVRHYGNALDEIDTSRRIR